MKKLISATEPRTIFVLGILAALKALSLVLIAEGIAWGVVAVIAGDGNVQLGITIGLTGGALRALVTWSTQSFAAVAALGAKQRLRRELSVRVLRGSSTRTGSAVIVGTLGLDELDNFYRLVLPSVITAATVPLLVGARILFADWVSALIIVITVPLVPVFMVLVGKHTQERADAASASLTRLSDHLVELARGLPVLVGLGRVEDQSRALRRISTESRATTMLTLRSAFLSSLVLELIATLSVAVVAVFVGVRLVGGDLTLVVGLIALILAPECFAPFRELGSAFHASQDGLAALRRARHIIDEPMTDREIAPGDEIRVSKLTVRRDDRAAAVVDDLSFTVRRGAITAITGASGSGKSTVLGVLAGTIQATGGTISGYRADEVAWVPQHPRTIESTVRAELRLYADDDTVVARLVKQFGLLALANADPARISLGELRRLAVARGFARVAAGASILILDEPTAHLDAANSTIVESAIATLRGHVTVLVASHESGIVELADDRIVVGSGVELREGDSPLATPALAVKHDASDPVGAYTASPTALATIATTVAGIAEFLGAAPWRMFAAVALGTGASLFALALTAVSGWLIVRASEQPPIMYLLVAIVGVRFFGLGRAGLRYSERLMTHDAVLGSVTELRQRMWAGLAVRGVADRALATGTVALDYLVVSADRVRDLVPRVVMPPAVALGTGIAASVAVAALHAPALPLLLAGVAVGLVVAPVVALVADRRAATAIGFVRSTVIARFTGAVTAADDVRANGISSRVLDELTELETRAASLTRSSAWALGLGQSVVVVSCVSMSMGMLVVAAPAVAAGTLPPAVVAVLALLAVGLIEPLSAAVDSMQQAPALAAALQRVRRLTGSVDTERAFSPSAPPAPRAATPSVELIRTLDFDGLEGGWPSDGRSVFGPLRLSASKGDWIFCRGASGTGKSTMLATLLGYLDPVAGSWSVNGTPVNGAATRSIESEALRSRIAWCPQDAYLFDSSIRGNLLLARSRDDRPTDAELHDVLGRVGLSVLLSTMPNGLDSPVGSGGNLLSGGERQRLAVARTLLSRAELVLLDEPTAHLDGASASELMNDLRSALRDCIVVVVSHHGDEQRSGDHVLTLDRASSAAITRMPSATSPKLVDSGESPMRIPLGRRKSGITPAAQRAGMIPAKRG